MNQSATISHFDGADVTAADTSRLTTTLSRVRSIMQDGQWYSVSSLQTKLSSVYNQAVPETSLSAQIRNLRKPKFGGHTIERKRVGLGQYEYRLA